MEQSTTAAVYRIELRDAVAKYEEEYPDLAKNPRLRKWVDEETEVVQLENPAMSPREVLETAAKSVQSQVNELTTKKEDVGENLDTPERVDAKKKVFGGKNLTVEK